MELIKLLDLANPKKVKDTINSLLNEYASFTEQNTAAVNSAINTANTAKEHSTTALNNSEQAVAEAQVAVNTSIGAKETADDAYNIATEALLNSENAVLYSDQAFDNANEAMRIAEAADALSIQAQQESSAALEFSTNANTKSDNAVNTADEALALIQAAYANAEAAVNTANAADTKADTAIETANSANTKSDSAVSLSDTANNRADAAMQIADTANKKSDNAVTTANNALETSNTANINSQTAINTSSEAKEIAQDALEQVTEGLGTQVTVDGVLQSTLEMSPYVKNTDYATTTKAGVLKLGSTTTGLQYDTSGYLKIMRASLSDITNKTDLYKPLVPAYIDQAVKTGLTTNTIELTAEEKTAAQKWLSTFNKPKFTSGRRRLIAIAPNAEGGSEVVVEMGGSNAVPTGYAVPVANAAGNIAVAAPTENKHAVNKEYVDDIAASLAGQNEYIGSYEDTDYTEDNIQSVLSTYVINNTSRAPRGGDLVNIVNGIYEGQQWRYNNADATWKYYIDFENHSVINNLTSDSEIDGLAAKQGKVLKSEIDTINQMLQDTFVKNTDYASAGKPGVIKLSSDYGLVRFADGYAGPYRADVEDIKNKTNLYRPIVPANLDAAIAIGITTNNIRLTDEEKTSAQSWLGVPSLEQIQEIADSAKIVHTTEDDLSSTELEAEVYYSTEDELEPENIGIQHVTQESLKDPEALEENTYYSTSEDDLYAPSFDQALSLIDGRTKRYLVESWVSDDYTSGYNIYSDNYKEQWGKSYVNENAALTVILPTPMLKDEYNVIVSNASGKTSGNAEGVITALPVDKTSIKISTGYIDPNSHNVYWQVKGY